MTKAIKKLIADSQWRDIGEAPKDGTIVIAGTFEPRTPLLIGACAFCRLPILNHDGIYQSYGWVESMTDELHHPTHFMPLPDKENRLAEVCQVFCDMNGNVLQMLNTDFWEKEAIREYMVIRIKEANAIAEGE